MRFGDSGEMLASGMECTAREAVRFCPARKVGCNDMVSASHGMQAPRGGSFAQVVNIL